jgi:hypothetical protein
VKDYLDKASLFHALKRFYFKVWWMDVLYPLVLSGLLFWSLSYLLYSGQKHRRVSSQIETRLLYWSLWSAGPRVLETASPFVTLSLVEEDFQTLNQLNIHEHRDTSLINYAFLLNRLLDLDVKTIFIHWQPDAFPESSHYEPFFPVIDRAKELGIVLYFVVHPTLFTSLPFSFRDKARLLEADPCDPSLQIFCVYDKVWNKWVMQKISKIYWSPHTTPHLLNPISYNLPPQSAAHLLYYNAHEDFIDFSFRDILEMDSTSIEPHKTFFHGKTIFIGNSLVQGRSGMMKSSDTNRVKTVLNPLYSSARRTGTPLHKFWAQHAQMFHDNALIGIVPQSLSISLALFLALTIIVILHLFGPLHSLATFILLCGLGPIFNIFAIRYLYTYIPIFDSLYACFLSFLLATFVKLSIESFYHWRLRIQQKSDLELLSAKNHFISLLSHNLNTPVAKMQGILSAVENYTPSEALRKDLQKAQGLISTIQLSIRSVLVTTALEERELNHEALIVCEFLQNFQESMSKTLNRLGMDVKLSLHEDDITQMPVRFDRRALSMGLASFLILLKDFYKLDAVNLNVSVVHDKKQELGLFCKILTPLPTLDEFLASLHQTNPSFLEELLRLLFNSFLKIYGGKVSDKDDTLCLFLPSSRV